MSPARKDSGASLKEADLLSTEVHTIPATPSNAPGAVEDAHDETPDCESLVQAHFDTLATQSTVPSRKTAPIPPEDDRAASEFSIFQEVSKQVIANLERLRKNMRYHVDRPNLEKDMKLEDIRLLTGDIVLRAQTKDTSKPHKNIRPLDHLPTPIVVFADTPALVADLVDCIMEEEGKAAPDPAIISMDCEGVDLGRNGSLTLVQFYIPAAEKVYIVDVQTLGHKAFSIFVKRETEAVNLKMILESEETIKTLWDCRSDSDALKWHFDVTLQGIFDGQLAEIATRQRSKAKHLFGLDTAVRSRLNFSEEAASEFLMTKMDGSHAMDEGIDRILHIRNCREDGSRVDQAGDEVVEDRVKNGLAISAMVERPLPPLMIEYCTQDVIVLPMLIKKCIQSKYWDDGWSKRVQEESGTRLWQARSANYDPSTMRMTAPPDGWTKIERSDHTG